jgi:hypothetical protein
MIASRSPGRKKRTGRAQTPDRTARGNVFYAVRGTVSGADIELTVSADVVVTRSTTLRVWSQNLNDQVATVTVDPDGSPQVTVEGTVTAGAAVAGNLVEFPDVEGAIRGVQGQGLGPGFIELV